MLILVLDLASESSDTQNKRPDQITSFNPCHWPSPMTEIKQPKMRSTKCRSCFSALSTPNGPILRADRLSLSTWCIPQVWS